MKALLQLVTSVVALGGLLGSVASHATDIAELPLKAAALAKPNVIFGMDDSGSMDFEVLLDTPSGLVYWQDGTAWNGTTNTPRTSSANFSPLSYLFPMGTGTGGQLYATDGTYGRVAPPIPQLAWLRSSRFNPLYYNPKVTYKPWSDAYITGTQKKIYLDATPTAARSHPEYSTLTINLTQDWNIANQGTTFSDNDRAFRVLDGMKLPIGTSVPATTTTSGVCNNNRQTLTAAATVGSGLSCRAGVPYYPATFWQPTVCPTGDTSCIAAPDCGTTSDNPTSNCVAAPNGSGKLRRYEIKSTNAADILALTGRTYAAEIQNFANWFQFHRKRKLMLAGSMGKVLENITGVRMGVVPFKSRSAITMYDADSTDVTKNRLAVAGRFYTNGMEALGTPTLATIDFIGTQVNTDSSIIRFACQRNSTFVVTDGFANDNGTKGTLSYTGAYGKGSPYATTYDGTQAALALAYYGNQLRASGDNALPAGLVKPSTATTPDADTHTNLHLNFYAISLGVKGSQYQPGRNPYTDAPSWTQPVNDDPSMIDDLWHATINGRGKMYLATTPTETAASIESGLLDILNFPGAQSGVAVASVNLESNDGFAYMGAYTPARWAGDLTANAINSATAAISATPTWSGATLLAARDYTTRNIAAFNGTAGVAFTTADTTLVDKVNPANPAPATGRKYGTHADVFAYLRGDRSKEGSQFRVRTSLMGAVINAQPVVDRDNKLVYVASGEGMLHAFDTTPGADRGKELWAFVPNDVLGDIGQTVERSYSFKTQLDGTPSIGKSSDTTRLLVAGMGASGRSYYALDVTTPRTNTEANAADWVKWQFPAAGDTTNAAKVGQTLGKPLLVKTAAGYRVLVTSGYNNGDGIGRVFVLDPSNGSVLKEFPTAASSSVDMGLAHIAAFQDTSGLVRYAYGGDLLGNLWAFDLDAASGTAPTLLASFKDSSSVAQPITAAPDLTLVDGKRVVLIGTGRLLDITDWGKTATQTFYAISDGTTVTAPRSSLVKQDYDLSKDTIDAKAVDWATKRGWFMDLPSGEQANTRPSVAYGAVVFTTNKAGANDCSASSRMYVVDIEKGAKSDAVSYVSTPISNSENSSGVTVVTTTNDQLEGLTQTGDGQGKDKEVGKMTVVSPAKNTWREVRRR